MTDGGITTTEIVLPMRKRTREEEGVHFRVERLSEKTAQVTITIEGDATWDEPGLLNAYLRLIKIQPIVDPLPHPLSPAEEAESRAEPG